MTLTNVALPVAMQFSGILPQAKMQPNSQPAVHFGDQDRGTDALKNPLIRLRNIEGKRANALAEHDREQAKRAVSYILENRFKEEADTILLRDKKEGIVTIAHLLADLLAKPKTLTEALQGIQMTIDRRYSLSVTLGVFEADGYLLKYSNGKIGLTKKGLNRLKTAYPDLKLPPTGVLCNKWFKRSVNISHSTS